MGNQFEIQRFDDRFFISKIAFENWTISLKILAVANGAITFDFSLNFSSFLPDVE